MKNKPMNAKQFNTEKEKLYKAFKANKTDLSHEVYIDTKFGRMYVAAEYIPRIKVASIHSRLVGDNLNAFKEETGYNVSIYNGKCNFYSEDPIYILDSLEEYLDNLNYLS